LGTRTIEISVAVAASALGLGLVAAQGHYEVARSDQRRDQMVMSVLEAQVVPEQWAALQQSYETRARVLPPQIVESFLVQSATDSTLWRILTVWRSREALEQMRQSGETPTGVLIFRDAGAEPSLTIFSVRANPRAPSDPVR
jgi:hypothetical protein